MAKGAGPHSPPREVSLATTNPRRYQGTSEAQHFILLVFKSKNTTAKLSAGHVYLGVRDTPVTQAEFTNGLLTRFNLLLPQEQKPAFSIQFSPTPVPEDYCTKLTSILPFSLEKMIK